MYTAQQVQGPVAPAPYGGMQVAGATAYYPLQTEDPWSGMMGMMMPMIMMVMMMAIMMPMLKGVTAKD